jgi:hypothetical protein
MRSLRASSSPDVCGQHTGAMTDTEAVRICRGELGAVEGVQRAAADEPDELIVRRYLWMLPPAGVTMGRADHRDIVLVAGTDPCAYKGTVDVMRPHVRPDGEGGCLR